MTKRFAPHHVAFALLVILVLSLALGTGCKKKPKAEPEASDPWASTLETLASHVPADASSAVFIIDFTTAFASYQGLRERAAAYLGDISSIEADLRNTLGVDPVRPQNLVNIGVNPRGGAFCAVIQEQSVCGVMLSDSDVFRAHVEKVLHGQPFNLRAPVVSSDLPSGGTLLRFAQDEGGELKAAVVQTPAIAYLILEPKAATLEGLAASLENVAAQPLSSHDVFQEALAHNQREAILAWMSPLSAAKAMKSITKLGHLVPNMDNIRGVLVGVKLSSDAIHGWFSTAIDPNDQRVRAMLTRPEGLVAADFSRFVTNDAYLVLRARTDAETLLATLRGALKEDAVEAAEATVTAMPAAEFEQRLVAALGSDMLVVATRARLLTLAAIARGGTPNAKALGDGLGLIAVYQLKDAAATTALLRDFDPSGTRVATTTDANGQQNSQIMTGPAAGTLLLIRGDMLIATTDRQLSDVQEMLAADAPPVITEISAEEGLALRTNTEDIGLFIDLKRVANNSIGQLAGGQLSPKMRDALQILDEFWMRANVEDMWLDGTYRVQLSTPSRR